MTYKVLIIDDDIKLNRLLTKYLSGFDYQVETVTHPQEGLKAIRKNSPDLIILDIMLPDLNGFEVCKTIRQSHSIPIIMLTARGEVTDRIVGLELGADDYLSKPFEPRELVARIQSVLRRGSRESKPEVKELGGLNIDFSKRTATLHNTPVDLTTMEFELLKLLVTNTGVVLDRDRIIEELRGIEWDAFNRSVDILMSRLRQKLNDDPKHPSFIKTIWGTGYMFLEQNNSSG